MLLNMSQHFELMLTVEVVVSQCSDRCELNVLVSAGQF